MDQLTEVDPSIAQAYQPSQAFLMLMRERRGDELEAWVTAAAHSGIETLAWLTVSGNGPRSAT